MRAAGLRLRPGLRPPALRPAPLRQHCACRCASTMQVFETVGSYRDFRASLPGGGGGGVGLVATMGYLHDGHLSLARHARAENETVVATIFVNPMQFAAHEDLDTYPRDSERDLALLESVGVDAVLMPPRDEVYDAGAHSRQRPGPARPAAAGADPSPRGAQATASSWTRARTLRRARRAVRAAATSSGALQQSSRSSSTSPSPPAPTSGTPPASPRLPQHCHLLTAESSGARRQKDAMQCALIRKLVRELNVPTEVVVVPTEREDDGLAMSSRNVVRTLHF